MAKVSVAEFIDFIQRSRIARQEDLQVALKRLSDSHDGRVPNSLDTVAEHLIASGVVTQWQCTKLKERKYRGFFLGKYKLLGHLGSGGMSTVYLAEHTKMHRRVAIKVLPRKRVDDSSHLERFYREAQAAAALDDPNIVRAYDIDVDGSGLHYLVMEFVPGSDLKKVAAPESQPLDIELVVHYISQAAAGLQHAHEAGLVHRDVKPANLLVDAHHQLKLLDLGLALTGNEEKSLTEEHDEKVFGTADYLAPEQALNSHNVDARVDIYALGCTLYYALVGHAPFPAGTLAQRVAQHQSAEPQPLDELRPDCPPSLVEICQRMMRKHPDQRYQTAEEVHKLLVRWLAERHSRWSGTHRTKSDSSVSETPRVGFFPHLGDRPALANPPLEAPIVVTDAHSRVARHRDRGRKKKKEQRPTAETTSTPAPESATQTVPTAIPITPDVGEVGIVTDENEKPLLETRRERTGRAKKPPIGLWVFLVAMVVIAIGLAIIAARSGAILARISHR